MVYTVKDLMYTDFPKTDGQTTVKEAARILKAQDRSFLVIMQEDSPVGIVTERDFVRRVIARDVDPNKTKITEIMSIPLVTLDPDADLSEAVEMMKRAGIHKLPIVKEKKLYGVITSRLLTRHFNEYVDRVTREIIRHASFAHFSL
ncbi:MAG: cyclic nucleotide-binding/CBS domain-containing protein [Candidatus Hodarchaeota archaeon]